MTRFVSFPLALAAALALSLTACGGDDKKSGSAASTPAGTTPAPSVTPSAPSGTPGESVTRTAAELTKALLVLSDLPSGFSQEKDEPDDNAKPFSSPSSRCKTLVKYLNATKAPGSKASVTRSFSGSQEGPYIDFGLDSMGTADKVADLRDTYEDAVDSCSKVTLKTEGEGSTSMKVEKISAHPVRHRPVRVPPDRHQRPEARPRVHGRRHRRQRRHRLGRRPGRPRLELDAATEAAVTKAQQVLKAGA